jgi:hypothetical protein
MKPSSSAKTASRSSVGRRSDQRSKPFVVRAERCRRVQHIVGREVPADGCQLAAFVVGPVAGERVGGIKLHEASLSSGPSPDTT